MKTNIKFFLISLFFFWALFIFTRPILAQEELAVSPTPASSESAQVIDIKDEATNPEDSFKYILKRLKENILLTITFSSDKKAKYYQKLVDVRLAELKHIVDNKDVSNIQTTSQRYFTTAGKAVEFVNSKNLSDQKTKLKDIFQKHLIVLEQLKKSYSDDTSEWRYLQHNVEYINIYIQQL